ncbi:DASS family sodium-coupled anion symporter [Pollutibacter soli]|uniref:SLC13 family permease n=1 Tax=Pollutibacter soli TaxID=3034157 RepID=UPI0030133A65
MNLNFISGRFYKFFSFWLGPALFFIFLLFNPLDLEPKAVKVIAIAALMITWWIGEALPMPAVALIPLVLFPLMNINTISKTAAPYANEVIFLFMGGFMIGLAIEKWNLHKRIALSIVKLTGTSGDRIILGFILSTGFISMWLSNTATTMMMFPIAASVISVVQTNTSDKQKAAYFSLSIMLSIAYASNFGGIATIIGTPPNVAYASFINKHYNYDISFAQWMIICTPIAVLLLLSLYIVMVKWLYPNRIAASEEMKNMIHSNLKELGPMTVPEKRVLTVFLITAGLWITKDLINELKFFRLDDNMIAVFGALMMFILPAGDKEKKEEKLLDWSDTKKMAWGILLLFGGGITLANALQDAGLIELLGKAIADYSGTNLLLIVIVITVVSIFMSEVMSNIAQVIVIAPVVTGIAEALHINPFMLGLPMTLAASAASMMPMGTPPNAIVFASGYIQLKQMIRVGFVMNMVSIILIVLFCYFVLPHIITLGK